MHDATKKLAPGSPLWACLAWHAYELGQVWLDGRRQPSYYFWCAMVPFAPYCLHKTNLPDAFCVVNRVYKRLGYSKQTERWTDYEAATQWHVSRNEFERLRAAELVNEHGYLFSDSSAPWRSRRMLTAYVGKLDALLAPWGRR
jgi:hypothetical protein